MLCENFFIIYFQTINKKREKKVNYRLFNDKS